MEKWREESETIASPYRDLKEKDKSVTVKLRVLLESWGSKRDRDKRKKKKPKRKLREDSFSVKSLIPSPMAFFFESLPACGFDRSLIIPINRS